MRPGQAPPRPERLGGALTVLGPAPCPIARQHGRWRWHVLAKAELRRAQGRAAAAVVADRDPVALL